MAKYIKTLIIKNLILWKIIFKKTFLKNKHHRHVKEKMMINNPIMNT